MNLLKLDNIFTHRSRQIDREAEFDKKSQKLQCFETLASYYRFRRYFNRAQYHQLHETPLLDKFSVAKKQLHDVDMLDDDFETCLQLKNPCPCIQNIVLDHTSATQQF